MRVIRTSRVVAALALLLISLPTAAQAHTTLASAIPAVNSSVSVWPTNISLTFAEDLQTFGKQEVNFLTVTNAAGELVSTGPIKVDKSVITSSLLPNSTQGIVLVNYRVAAADGHVVEGEYTFTYGKSSEVTPSSSPLAVAAVHAHGSNQNLLIFASSTILIVIALLFGWWAYRRESN
ncbi:MAG: copper resistance CopC family protein [Actinomycetes bacterium]